MKRIGIFGGSFHPPHDGHIRAAEHFLDALSLDLLYVIPSWIPPHKSLAEEDTVLPDYAMRLRMTRLAFSKITRGAVVVSDIEQNGGVSYTLHTLDKLARRHPKDRLYLYVGTDMFLSFETWFRFEEIFKRAAIAVMRRDADREKILCAKRRFEERYGADITLLDADPVDVSSTQIRKWIKNGDMPLHLDGDVVQYIRERGLYEKVTPVTPALAAALLSKQRAEHTLSVEKETASLCELFSLPAPLARQLRKAALLHDITKEKTFREQELLCERYDYLLSEQDKRAPKTVHAITASLLARHYYMLDEPACDAIRYHTTGRENMSLAEKLLFFADYIEEKRAEPSCRRMRAYFYGNSITKDKYNLLDECVLSCLEQTADYVKETPDILHDQTRRAIYYLRNHIGQNNE